jgi:hypothetical protein
MKRFLAVILGLSVSVSIRVDCLGEAPHEDHLVPVGEPLGLRAVYEQLWRQKLLVTPGEIARFVGLPGTIGLETTISVYRAPEKENSLAGNYWVTATQASQRLWNCVEPGVEGKNDPDSIRVVRCDAPIPESTALALHTAWLAMLSRSRPQHKTNEIVVDSSREIFSAADSSGRVLEAQGSTAPKENTKALINMALSLLEYCGSSADGRTNIASTVEREAKDLLRRVTTEQRPPVTSSSGELRSSSRRQRRAAHR